MHRLPFVFTLVVFLFAFSASAQRRAPAPAESSLRYDDYVYVPYIRSVQLYVEGLALSYPMLDLNGSSRLHLEFDDLEADAKNYFYRILYCDMDWKPAKISEMEYLDGFSEDRITEYQFSFKTFTPYTHYTLQLPNSSMNWKLSGNYLLVVYEEGRQEAPVFTRRFVVVDSKVQVSAQLVRPNAVSKMRTHQEVDFIVNHENMPLRNPRQEIHAVVLQNGRWDNALVGLSPLFIRANQLVFDYQDQIVFPAGKEFRPLDLRSLRFRAPMVFSIENLRDRSEVTLNKDGSRESQPYIEFNDINGKFVLETKDQSNPLAANYAEVLFSLAVEAPFYDDDVYITGQFSQWQLLPEYRMTYNNAINSYVLKTTLKQGFYNYAYARSPKSAEKPLVNLSPLEGDWFETENDYTILIYYRPFGGRFDELIGMYHLNSRGN